MVKQSETETEAASANSVVSISIPIARKKINSPLTDWQYADGTFFEHWLNGLKHIAVVSTRQASVTCNDDQAALFDFTLLLIRRRKIIRRRSRCFPAFA